MRFFGLPQTKDDGFSLIEVLVAITIGGMLLALSAQPLRNYWFKQSLFGARDALTTEMASMQSLVTSESHPLVYGIRFSDAAGFNAVGQWGLVRYDPTSGAGGTPTCTQYATGTSNTGFFNAPVQIIGANVTPATPTTEQSFCRSSLKDKSGAAIGASTDQFLFYYARGTATGGSLTLRQPSLGPSADLLIQVRSLTGRAE